MNGSRWLSCRHRGFPLKAVVVLPALSVPGSVRAARPERAAQTWGQGTGVWPVLPLLGGGRGREACKAECVFPPEVLST